MNTTLIVSRIITELFKCLALTGVLSVMFYCLIIAFVFHALLGIRGSIDLDYKEQEKDFRRSHGGRLISRSKE